MENRKFALGVQSDSVPVRTNFQLVFTSISHSNCVFLVTGELSKLESFENSVWLGTCSRSKTESSDGSFVLDATSMEGTSRVSETPSDECLLSGRTVRNETAEILSSCPFLWIFPPNLLEEYVFYSFLQVIGSVSSHVSRPHFSPKDKLSTM